MPDLLYLEAFTLWCQCCNGLEWLRTEILLKWSRCSPMSPMSWEAISKVWARVAFYSGSFEAAARLYMPEAQYSQRRNQWFGTSRHACKQKFLQHRTGGHHWKVANDLSSCPEAGQIHPGKGTWWVLPWVFWYGTGTGVSSASRCPESAYNNPQKDRNVVHSY